MQAALKSGRVTSREIVRQYLQRIGMYEDMLHAAITVNPKALELAGERDRERAAGKIRGPLHGIPIALKDNVHTTFMRTTGGALAFENLTPPYDATLTKNLIDAGAIIIAKTGMSELANWVAGAPTPMPANYNAVGGQAYNPYDPRKDPRDATFDGRPALQTGGSSSGVGTSANFWAGNVGTETSGSILSPSNQNMLAAIKPTVGRISRYGVIPITADQDTAGPMAKSVADVAIMFGAMESAAPDPNDPATRLCTPAPGRDYTKFLKKDGLKGARIGIPRASFYDAFTPPGPPPPDAAGRGGRGGAGGGGGGGLNPDQKKAMEDAIAVLKAQGAIIVDPANIPSVVDQDPKNNFLRWSTCSGANAGKGKDEDCSIVFKYGMKRDFNAWLKSLGAAAPLKSLTELREFNTKHANAGAIKYGQSLLDISDEMDVEKDRARYEADRAKDLAAVRRARHRRGDEGRAARRAAVPGRRRRRHRREARLPDGDRAVRAGAECADAGVSGGLQREARPVRRQLHRHGLQRAEAARARVLRSSRRRRSACRRRRPCRSGRLSHEFNVQRRRQVERRHV